MSKRFTETEKWSDPWFRKLPGVHKLTFIFLTENCNNAGFYEMDVAHAAYMMGVKEEHVEGAIKALSRGITQRGDWIWVHRFLRHQKNERLSEHNPAHRQIASLVQSQLERFSGVPLFDEFVALNEPLIGGLKAPIIGKGQVQVQEGDETQPVTPKKKANSSLMEDPSGLRLAAIFGRRATTPWSSKELSAFRGLGEIPEEDLAMVEKYYASERAKGDNGIHRRDLGTFLNNFAGELDRARARGFGASSAANTQPAKNRFTKDDVDPADYQAYLHECYEEDDPRIQEFADIKKAPDTVFGHYCDTRNIRP